jgi:hypothetical protein
MEHQYEQALSLYIKKLMDNLSTAEETYIHKMLAVDNVFRRIWFSLEKESHSLDSTPFHDCIEIKQKKIFPFRKITAITGLLELIIVSVRKQQ